MSAPSTMHLTDVPGIGPAFAQRLRSVGVHDAESLAKATDVPALAQATGIPRARLEASVIGARLRLGGPTARRRVEAEAWRDALAERAAELAGHALTLREWAVERMSRVMPQRGNRGRAT